MTKNINISEEKAKEWATNTADFVQNMNFEDFCEMVGLDPDKTPTEEIRAKREDYIATFNNLAE